MIKICFIVEFHYETVLFLWLHDVQIFSYCLNLWLESNFCIKRPGLIYISNNIKARITFLSWLNLFIQKGMNFFYKLTCVTSINQEHFRSVSSFRLICIGVSIFFFFLRNTDDCLKPFSALSHHAICYHKIWDQNQIIRLFKNTCWIQSVVFQIVFRLEWNGFFFLEYFLICYGVFEIALCQCLIVNIQAWMTRQRKIWYRTDPRI